MLSNAEQVMIGMFVFFIILCVVCLVVPAMITPKHTYKANRS